MASSDLHVILGLGATGFSCARFLHESGIPIAITDTRKDPPYLSAIQKLYPTVPIFLGEFNDSLLQKADTLVVSPGISLRKPIIAEQIKRGMKVIGDIELFARHVTAPVIAITGTNAKSTVTTLVGKMAKMSGLNVEIGGNLGVPALDLLMQNQKADLFVLELSSFQLETTFSLKPAVASILNITPDHMDRYENLAEYAQAKYRIYQHCLNGVYNLDDPLTECHEIAPDKKFYFTLNTPQKNGFGLRIEKENSFLAHEDRYLLATQELPITGKHYQANALAALAIGFSFGLPFDPMLNVLKTFKGLPHRCELVREYEGVRWFNDSKGTNVGATFAAIEGLGSEIKGKIILIAGGVGKNANFVPLLPALKKYVRHVVLIGEAADEIAHVIDHEIPFSLAASMDEAVDLAHKAAKKDDCVLLSPACASFDMFKNFEHRGDVFSEIVKRL